MQDPSEYDFKLFCALFMSLAGVIFYMTVAPEFPKGVWILLDVLAAVVVVLSLIERKENPLLLLRAALFAALFLAIVAGVTWFYIRGRALGILTAVSVPIAVGLSIWALRWRN